MTKVFAIDFVRQILEQTMFEEHLKNVDLFGGNDQVSILSFYEQLKAQDEVDRFVETFRDLSEQQNRTGLILNGVLVSPENPTITNLYSCLIIPLTWSLSFRCLVANRDNAIVSINNLITQLKGKKVDIAQLECIDDIGGKCYKPFKVGTMGQNFGTPVLKDFDYIGTIATTSGINALVDNLVGDNKPLVATNLETLKYLYVTNNNKLKLVHIKTTTQEAYASAGTTTILEGGDVIRQELILASGYNEVSRIKQPLSMEWTYIDSSQVPPVIFRIRGNGRIVSSSTTNNVTTIVVDTKITTTLSGDEELTFISIGGLGKQVPYIVMNGCDIVEEPAQNIILPPEHESFEKYKVSLSFDAIRCDEPRNLNAEEYCELTISGSATLVNESVALGNDLLKVGITKIGINAQTPITFTNPTTYWVEPMEMPSGSNANTQINQLVSNNFMTNTHTDAIALSLQYSFICDKSNDLLKQLFKYARYGTRGVSVNDISPNMIFSVKEIWSSWGEYEENEVKAKIVENIDIENTESDTLTIGLTMQIQGDNN